MVDISVFVGPMLSSPNEKAKPEGLLTASLAPPFWGSISLVHSRYPCPKHWLKTKQNETKRNKTRARFPILRVYQGRKGKHEICNRASASTLPLEVTSA